MKDILGDNNMADYFHVHKLIKVAVFLVLAITAILGCIPALPPDTVKEEIPLAEAQKLLPFQVCLPEYVPAGLKISDTVRYHDEFGDPNESDITIDYLDIKKQEVVFTIYERHGPVGELDIYDDVIRRLSLRDLIVWQVGWSQVESLQSQVDVEYKVYTHNSDRLIVEIKSPESLRAVLITWTLSEFVLIDIYSHLSVDETKLIANSMPDCGFILTATP